MKYVPLIWAALWRKPLRTVLCTLALTIAFMLFGLLEGINAGFEVLARNSRMDRLYVVPRFGTPMPLAYTQQIARMPGVASVTPVVVMPGFINGDLRRPIAVHLAGDGYFDFYSYLDATRPQIAELRGQRAAIVIGKAVAIRLGVKAGDRIAVNAAIPKKDGGAVWEFDVLAVVDRTDIPDSAQFAVGNFEYVNEDRATAKDLANQLLVAVKDAEIAAATGKAIDAEYLNSGAPTRTFIEKLVEQDNQTNSDIPQMVHVIVLSTMFALLLVTTNAMMQSFRERIPQFGALKAIGFSDGQVLGLVLGEALVQCLLGAGLGLICARFLMPLAKGAIPVLGPVMTMSWSLIGLGLLLAFLVALITAAIPAWRAGRMQVVTALAAR